MKFLHLKIFKFIKNYSLTFATFFNGVHLNTYSKAVERISINTNLSFLSLVDLVFNEQGKATG